MTLYIWKYRFIRDVDNFEFFTILLLVVISLCLIYGIDFIIKKLKKKPK